MKRKAWEVGKVVKWYERVYGMTYTRVYLWDDHIGFKLRFGIARLYAEYTSKGARS